MLKMSHYEACHLFREVVEDVLESGGDGDSPGSRFARPCGRLYYTSLLAQCTVDSNLKGSKQVSQIYTQGP